MEDERRREGKPHRRRKENGEQIQIDRMVARSVIVILGGWMNVSDVHCRFRGTISENKRNWFGPSGKESMCEGHVSASLMFCVETWGGLSKVFKTLRQLIFLFLLFVF